MRSVFIIYALLWGYPSGLIVAKTPESRALYYRQNLEIYVLRETRKYTEDCLFVLQLFTRGYVTRKSSNTVGSFAAVFMGNRDPLTTVHHRLYNRADVAAGPLFECRHT